MKVAVSRAVHLQECPLGKLLLLLFSPSYKRRSTPVITFSERPQLLSFLNISVVYESTVFVENGE